MWLVGLVGRGNQSGGGTTKYTKPRSGREWRPDGLTPAAPYGFQPIRRYPADMKVHEIMTADVRSVAPDTTLVEAAGLMRELDVGALPVCDGDELAGLVTDRDMVVRGIADGNDPNVSKVSDVMSGGVEAVSADDDVENAVRIMEQRQIRRLPVLDREKRLVGMISLGDVAITSNPAFGGMALRDISEPNSPTARQKRLMQRSEPTRMPRVPGSRQSPKSERRTREEEPRSSSRTSAKPGSRGRAAPSKVGKAKAGRTQSQRKPAKAMSRSRR